MKKTHNRVGRFAAAFESIQRRLQLESHPTAGSASGSHSSTLPLLSVYLHYHREKNTSREREEVQWREISIGFGF